MNQPLTKTEEVLAVLKAGGRVGERSDGGLVLRDNKNSEIPAWQNAMRAARRIHEGAKK